MEKRFTFSEHCYVAYQIKGNDECHNMQAHILSVDTPSIPKLGPEVKTTVCVSFLKVVMVHIKWEWSREDHASTYSVHINTLDPWCGVKRSKDCFTDSSTVSYQIKGNGT